MIGTVTLNPCIDRTCKIAGFEYGGMNRIIQDRRDVSGKGINVSLALHQFGLPVKTTGFLYRDNSAVFLDGLRQYSLEYDGIEVDGDIRENIKLWDSNSDVTTEVNQKGAFVSEEKCDEFKRHFESWSSQLDIAVISGSVPLGVDKTIYRDLINIAGKNGVRCILDAEGELLSEGLKARPFLIKPNRYEFCLTFKPKDDSIPSIIARVKEILEEDLCSIVCVTLGKNGALIANREGGYLSNSLDMDIKCTQGAGDSVVAGICIALSEGKDISQMLRYGMAMAAGTLSREGTLMCRKEDFERFLPLICVSKA